jgi:hypothetical protein
MHALRLPSRHLWLTALLALGLALLFVIGGELVSQIDLNLFSGGGTAVAPTDVPPATWASNPMAPPTILLAH